MDNESAETKFDGATPVFLVSDIASTMRWYATHLGFSVRGVPESPPHDFGFLTKDNVTIFLQQLDGYRKPELYDKREGGVWNVYVKIQGVRELYAVLSKVTDVTLLEPLCHQPYGQTEFVIRDPNGYTLVLAERD
jgi:catechol 2,3-dioxygenase-like lactoylglutathione lyase family enzyme